MSGRLACLQIKTGLSGERKAVSKILIFGNSGSGKSTLAKTLANSDDLAHLDLDIFAWLPVVPPERAPLEVSKKKIQAFSTSSSNWVIEGCYSDLLEIVAPEATEIIFLNLSVAQCLINARNRPWEPHKYPSKKAQDRNLGMLLNWIETYTERDDVFSYRAHLQLYENFTGKKTMFTENERGREVKKVFPL